jgi:quercetin dioxygenase-like cupin family protein
MRLLRSKKTLALSGAALVAVALAAAGLSAVWATVVHVDTLGGLHFRVVSMSADGFDSGWHTHPGLVVVQVREGSLQMTQANCATKTVAAGDTFIEVPFQPLRAVATGRAVWTTTFLTKVEEPLATQVASPCP